MFTRNIALIIAGVVFFLAVTAVIFIKNSYNRFSFFERDIAANWERLDAHLQEGYAISTKLSGAASSCFRGKEDLLADMEAALVKIADPTVMRHDNLVLIRSDFHRSIKKFIATLNECPSIKANSRTASLLSELRLVEEKIVGGEKRYNDSVEKYNTSISGFPANVIAGILGLQKRTPFEKTAPQAQ